MYSKKVDGTTIFYVPPEEEQLSGFASNGKHTRFFTTSGNSYRVRAIEEWESEVFRFPLILTALFCTLTAFALLRYGAQHICGSMLFGAGIDIILCAAIWRRRTSYEYNDVPPPIAESIIAVTGTFLLVQWNDHLLHASSVALWIGILVLLAAASKYMVWNIQRQVWEPSLMVSLSAILSATLIMVGPKAVFPISILFMSVGCMAFLLYLRIMGDGEFHRRKMSSIPE